MKPKIGLTLSPALEMHSTQQLGGTQLHSCMGKLRHIGQISSCSHGMASHLVASSDQALVAPVEEQKISLLDQSEGQSRAVGASDCKTLMNVRRLKPTSHLAGWRH